MHLFHYSGLEGGGVGGGGRPQLVQEAAIMDSHRHHTDRETPLASMGVVRGGEEEVRWIPLLFNARPAPLQHSSALIGQASTRVEPMRDFRQGDRRSCLISLVTYLNSNFFSIFSSTKVVVFPEEVVRLP